MINKEELVNRVAKKYNVTKADTKLWVDGIFDVLAEAVVEDEVKIRGFGTFEHKRMSARIGRNLNTNEACPIPARTKIAFKAHHDIDDAVRDEKF